MIIKSLWKVFIGFILIVQCFFLNSILLYSAKIDEIDEKETSIDLNLPDVLIYGTERVVRSTGQKIKSSLESIYLKQVKQNKKIIELDNSTLNNKIVLTDKFFLSRNLTTCKIGYGSYDYYDLQLNQWQEFDNLNYGFKLNFDRTAGQYLSSSRNNMSGKFNIGIQLHPLFSSSLAGSVINVDYGLYGAPISNIRRKISQKTIGINSFWNCSSQRYTSLSLMYDLTSFNYNKKFPEMKEKNYQVEFSYVNNISKNHQFLVTAKYLDINNDVSFQLIKMTPEFIIRLSQSFNLKTKFEFEKITFFNKEKISPGVAIIFTPNRKFGISVKGSRYFKAYNLNTLRIENAYFDPTSSVMPADVKMDLELKIETTLGNQFSWNSGLSQKRISNYSYWQRNQESGLFSFNKFQQVIITQIFSTIDYQIKTNLSLRTSVDYNVDDIHDDFYQLNEKRIPYLEQWRLPVELNFQVSPSLKLALNSTFFGPRRVNAGSTKELKSYNDLSLNAEKKIRSKVYFFTECRNLTNSKFEIWEGYKEFGVSINIGLRGEW